MAGKVTAVPNKDDFEKQLAGAGSKLVLVDFHAVWCGPCRAIAPKIEQLSKKYEDVVFLKVDVDEAEDVAEEYGVQAMPTFLFFKNGRLIDGGKVVGADEKKIEDAIIKFKA